MDLDPPLSGDLLEERLKSKIVHIPIAEGFIYQEGSVLVSSQPGVGKSSLAIQIAYELSLGRPVFGGIQVDRPYRVWYIQMERSETESLERLQLIRGKSNESLKNLFIDTELQTFNFLKESHLDLILRRGKEISPDLVIIDPLYGIARGLSKDEVASGVTKTFTILKKKLHCSLLILHHTVKTTYDIINGKKVEREDPFYGAQWLRAHVTGSYLVKKTENGVIFKLTKVSHSNHIEEIKTFFDEDTHLSTINTTSMSTWERYRIYILSLKSSGKMEYYFDDARGHLRCAASTLRDLHRTPIFKTLVEVFIKPGHKTLYKIKT